MNMYRYAYIDTYMYICKINTNINVRIDMYLYVCKYTHIFNSICIHVYVYIYKI